MNEYESDALQYATTFAAEAEKILGVNGIETKLAQVASGEARFSAVASRVFDIVDGATVAAMLINLFMWIGQIRRKQILKGASKEEIIQDLTIRVLNNDQLSAAAKERLLTKALDHLSPDGS